MNKKLIAFIMIISIASFISLTLYKNRLDTIVSNTKAVANFSIQLKELGCTVTNMSYDEVTTINHPNPMSDGKTYYTWALDSFGSIRWCTPTDFKALVGTHDFTSNNSFVAFTLQENITEIALIKESDTSYVFLSIAEVPRQTIWSYEHLGVNFKC